MLWLRVNDKLCNLFTCLRWKNIKKISRQNVATFMKRNLWKAICTLKRTGIYHWVGWGENDWSCLECSHQQTFNGKSVTLLKKCFYDKCFPTNLLELFRTNVLQKTFGRLFFQLPRFSPFKFNINYNFYNFILKFDSNVDVWLRLIMWSISLE